ncbi:MAG: chemotaxis protein CheX [Proteobacteria bacterium]|nr:chemotaxis protein CheX [Pseudomonadota bacterium]MBU0967217.1 chemotaxis protein CheX [Pseudomonadota bacterium]
MKAEFLNPFLSAAKSVIETMAHLSVRVKALSLKENKATYGVITGIIGLASETITGTMVISFSEPCILKIVSNMTGEPEKTKIDAEVVDAVGELTNMISGGAKNQLAKMKMKFDLSLPTTIVGKNIDIGYRANTPIIVIPFMTASGEFVVEANLALRT